MTRIGSALFNADHGHLADELRHVVAAGAEFLHFDVFDGHLVPDLAFAPRTIETLRPLTALPFEVHLAANDPLRFLPALKRAGADLVFLPAESTPMLYEAIFALRELDLRPGLCLALGTPLSLLEPVLPMLDAVLLLGRVTGEGQRGRAFNTLLLGRIAAAREMIDGSGRAVDLQAAGGLELVSMQAAVAAGATSLPIGAALHREPDQAAFIAHLRAALVAAKTPPASTPPAQTTATPRVPCRVLVASRSFGPHCPEAIARLQAAGCDLVMNPWGRSPSEAELAAHLGDVDVLVSGTEPVTTRVLAAAPRLRLIAKHGVGFENIDLAAARARDIPVCLAGDSIADSVADMAFALILALARHVCRGDRAVRGGGWPRIVGLELRGKTLGVVGLGAIGRGLCRRAKGFGLELVAHDPYPDHAFARSWGVELLDLEALLTRSDIVSLHAPVTAETRGMINARTLGLMRPGALLVNTARGALVDEADLYAALQSGQLGGAASDVFEREPPGDTPLLTLDTFIATPHSAGQTHDGLRRMGEATANNILRLMAGDELLNRVR